MIDYIKLEFPITHKEKFLNNSKIKWIDKVITSTGEVMGLPKGEFKNLKIEIFKSMVVVHGSVHVFYNMMTDGTKQNYNQFTFSMLERAIFWLKQELDFGLIDPNLRNIEFGVNIQIDQVPTGFLSQNVSMLRYRTPSQVNGYNGKGFYTEYTLGHYYVKLYAKSDQFNLDTPLIRFEIKTRKMKHVKPTKIKTLSDLLDKKKLMTLKSFLLNHLSNLLILDSLDFSRIKDQSDLMFIQRYTNPKQFNVLKGRKKPTYDRLIKKLDNYGYLNLKKEIVMKINEAWDKSLNNEPQFEYPPMPIDLHKSLSIPNIDRIHPYI